MNFPRGLRACNEVTLPFFEKRKNSLNSFFCNFAVSRRKQWLYGDGKSYWFNLKTIRWFFSQLSFLLIRRMRNVLGGQVQLARRVIILSLCSRRRRREIAAGTLASCTQKRIRIFRYNCKYSRLIPAARTT